MTEFTKEQLVYWSQTQPLAAFALAQMERAENAEATVKDYLTVQAELDASETAAKMYAARTLAAEERQKNAEAERDRLSDLLRRIEGLDEKADVVSWQQQAEDRADLCLKIAAERDRLIEDRRTLSLDELVYGTRAMHEVVGLRAERDRLMVELEQRRSVMSRLPFCPDHRDKVAGLECRECEVERIRKELEEAEKALREADFLIGGARISDVDRCAFRQMPAMKRAWERGGRGGEPRDK